jgi:hypothetical protein
MENQERSIVPSQNQGELSDLQELQDQLNASSELHGSK